MIRRLSMRLFIIIGIYLSIISHPLCGYAQPNQTILAELDKVEGAVEIKDPSGQWKKITAGMPIGLGDYIKTGRKSEALIVITNLDEKVKIKILEETETSLKDIVVSNLTGKQDSSILLNDGAISVATNEFHKNTAFKAVTPNAVVEMSKYGVLIKYKESSGE